VFNTPRLIAWTGPLISGWLTSEAGGFSHGVVLQDAQIRDRIRHSEAITPTDPPRTPDFAASRSQRGRGAARLCPPYALRHCNVR
jgi:hypothetical protein